MCITSPNYPRKYKNADMCNISVQDGYFATHGIAVQEFVTEATYDTLTVNGVQYHGGFAPPTTIRPSQTMYWSTDSSLTKKGWKICATALAANSLEGLAELPYAVHDVATALEGLQVPKLRGRRVRNSHRHTQGTPMQGHAFAQEDFAFMPEEFVLEDDEELDQDARSFADEL